MPDSNCKIGSKYWYIGTAHGNVNVGTVLQFYGVEIYIYL